MQGYNSVTLANFVGGDSMRRDWNKVFWMSANKWSTGQSSWGNFYAELISQQKGKFVNKQIIFLNVYMDINGEKWKENINCLK